MKHITKTSTLLIALTLAMSASAATQYCEKDVPSNQGESGTLTFTASKTGEKETTFILTTNTSNNFRALDVKGTLYNVVLQDPGKGSTSTIWREGWTLENNTLTKVVTWTTYPTNPIRLLIVANRDNSKGGSNIIGAEIADIDVSVSCDGSGDTDKWSGVSWVPHVQYTDYAETFKVETGCATPINLQDRNGIGIYMTFSKPIKSCSVGSHFEGSGLWIYLSSLTQKETEVTVTFTDSTECSFWIYNEDGSTEEPTVSDEWITVPYNGFSEYTDRFQVKSGCPNTTVENIQNKNSRLSIYIHFSQVISDCNVDSYYSGSGLWVYLSALTAEETTVNVTFTDGSTCSFIVKNSEPGTSSSGTSTYCQTPLTSGDCTIYVSNEKLSENNYRFTIEGEGLVDVHSTYYYNPANTKLVQTSVTPEKIICDFTATSTPKFYTPLYIKTTTKNEVVFNDIHNKELVWGTCSSSDIPDVEVPEDDEQEDAGYCLYTGVAGDGQTSGAGRQTFQSGYNIAMWLNTTKDSINIRLELLANDITDADNAYFHNYPTYSTITEIDQVGLTKESDGVFIGVIPISFISNNVDGIMRFGLKVEYPRGVIRVTTPEFFYLDGSGCAQRVFAIYHHDDLPATPLEGEDQFTEFAGGRILQSIQYKRRMPSEVWETLSVPFEVDRVTAFDPATGEHVPLQAQYSTSGTITSGNYWLRYFKTEKVTASNFQPNWYDIEAPNQEEAKPEKGKAYIIRLPNGGGYYNDKYIVFHGRGYQKIAEAYIAPDSPQDDYFSYSGNNTMMPQDLSSAYVLDNAGYYFTSSSTVTLPPFECSVNATAPTIAKMPRIALNGRNNTTTDLTLLPTTDLQGGVIYSIFGAAVARFNTIDEYDQACQTLAAGVYVVVTPSATTKIQIP